MPVDTTDGEPSSLNVLGDGHRDDHHTAASVLAGAYRRFGLRHWVPRCACWSSVACSPAAGAR